MIIAYISKDQKECFARLEEDFVDVKNLDSIEEFISFYAASQKRDITMVYRISTEEELYALSKIHFSNNIYIIVIGPEDTGLSLMAGKIGVDRYVTTEQVSPELIKPIIVASQQVIKRRRGKSNISVFTGISGGAGVTTITMNLANMIAKNHPEKNVLFLDFAYTKSISNLFFDLPQPEKNIIDITSIRNLDLEELFANGLIKYSNNLFFIPGIQRHTDREELEKVENIQRFLNFIHFAKEHFDFILIDVGVFEDVELEIDIQELSDQIFVVTELSIPSMSMLKTYIDIVDKSGWYNKTNIIVNRADSLGSMTEQDAEYILSKGLRHSFKITYSLPNDAMPVRESWNNALLVSDAHPESRFVHALDTFIERYFMHDPMLSKAREVEHGLFARVKQWL